MPVFGLIGKSLGHSFSKKYFEEKFIKEGLSGYSYQNFELPTIQEFNATLKTTALTGVNVTIPYKEEIIPFLDELDSDAKEIGAVNTIVISTINGKPHTKGYNTDIYGFQQSIKPFLNSNHQRALILGTGGASKAVAFALNALGIDYLFATRTPSQSNHIAYEDINDIVLKHFLFIVNTTPVGTFPNTEEAPSIPYHYLTPKHFLYDLVYNPSETLFLKKGKEHGCLTQNGLDMLKLQAEAAWEIWNTNA